MLKKDVSYIFWIILAFSLYLVIIGANDNGNEGSGSCCDGCDCGGCCGTEDTDNDNNEVTLPTTTEDDDVESTRTPHQNDCNGRGEVTILTVESFTVTRQNEDADNPGKYTYEYSFKIMACKTAVSYELELYSTALDRSRNLPTPRSSSYRVMINSTEIASDALHDVGTLEEDNPSYDKFCIKTKGENIDTRGICCDVGGTNCGDAIDILPGYS